ncbi:putative F-box protein At1g32420 [Rutidosis leptorrhynchoides]|uniref:putative F-box protein At1g32420 n=1 Tax=Rutidosis leptorrhynchoides TaxID=125765 RepID=UPI003A991E3E
MSDLVPFDIQIEFIKKLPIRSLIRFRSVSKAWKSLIDSSKFIHDNCLRDNQPHHLLVSYYLRSMPKYVSIMDDDSFPQNKFSPIAPVTLNRPRLKKLGSSRGIICILIINSDMVVLWNPTIRKSVGIAIPNMLDSHGYTAFGFGVCPGTSDPKLVKITYIKSSPTEWEVEMFTLSSGDWRSIPIDMPFNKPVRLLWDNVCINGVIYWCAGSENKHNRIISFDLTSEEFGEVFLWDSLARSTEDLFVSKLMDSLVVIIKSYNEVDEPGCDVWKMNHGVMKSWTKLYTVRPSAIGLSIIEFRKNGEPIIEAIDEYGSIILEVYDPCSRHVRDLKFDGNENLLTSCFVSSYTETLALLHQSDSIIY